MLSGLISGAWRLDQWMKEHVGRTYTVVLAIGLFASISANVRGIETSLQHPGNLVTIAITVTVDVVLLVNQLAQLHEYRQARRARKAAAAKPRS
jgi:hypothetical protein